MFDKKKFSDTLLKARGNRTNADYSKESGVSRAYISGYLNEKIDNPPSPDVIKRLSSVAISNISYEDLMIAAGYIPDKEQFIDDHYDDIFKEISEKLFKKHKENLTKIWSKSNIDDKNLIDNIEKSINSKEFDIKLLYTLIDKIELDENNNINVLFRLSDKELNRPETEEELKKYIYNALAQSKSNLRQTKDNNFLSSNKSESSNDICSINEFIKVPILGTIRAGQAILAIENIEGYELVQESEARNGEYFYLRVTGDSMIGARIYDGDLVFVKKQSDVDHGDIAVVLINGDEATLKRVLKTDNSIILQPENPKYIPMVFSQKDIESNYVQILGKVIHVKFNI